MVAKSYQGLEVVGDVFTSSGKQYVNVRLKSGKIKSVRHYTEAEYKKLYPDAVIAAPRSADPYYKPQRDVLGFEKGYITIFKGDAEEENEWFRASTARYAKWWGWYFVSTDEVPSDLPQGVRPVRLDWASVGTENGTLKNDTEVIKAVESILYAESVSQYVGSIGERLELYLTVEKTFKIDGNYPSTLHVFHDDCGNLYTWLTSAKTWAVGTEHHIRGTVKNHSVYKGEKRTELTRCAEVK